MVTVLAVLGVLGVLFAAGAVAVRDEAPLVPVARDHADLALPVGVPLSQADLEQVRFGLALRGYRMSEVDEVLDRLGRELADRDARLAELRAEVDRLHAAEGPTVPAVRAADVPAVPAGPPPAAAAG